MEWEAWASTLLLLCRCAQSAILYKVCLAAAVRTLDDLPFPVMSNAAQAASDFCESDEVNCTWSVSNQPTELFTSSQTAQPQLQSCSLNHNCSLVNQQTVTEQFATRNASWLLHMTDSWLGHDKHDVKILQVPIIKVLFACVR